MSLKRSISNAILCCLLTWAGNAFASNEAEDIINIEKLANAEVFASYTDELPAVLNYFTTSSKTDVIAFYKSRYGEVLTRDLKYKRLTLTFKENDKVIRVVISTQGKKRQVDVLVNAIN